MNTKDSLTKRKPIISIIVAAGILTAIFVPFQTADAVSVSVTGLPSTITQDPISPTQQVTVQIAINTGETVHVDNNAPGSIRLYFDGSSTGIHFTAMGFSTAFDPRASFLQPSPATFTALTGGGVGGTGYGYGYSSTAPTYSYSYQYGYSAVSGTGSGIVGPKTLEYTVFLNKFAFTPGSHSLRVELVTTTSQTFSSSTVNFTVNAPSGTLTFNTLTVFTPPPTFDALPDDARTKLASFGFTSGQTLAEVFTITPGVAFTPPPPIVLTGNLGATFTFDQIYTQTGLDTKIPIDPSLYVNKPIIPEPYFLDRTFNPGDAIKIERSIFTPIITQLPPNIPYEMPVKWPSGQVPTTAFVGDVIIKLASGKTATDFKVLVNDLAEKPTTIPTTPSGVIGKFFEVTPQGAGVNFGSTADLADAKIKVNIEKSWVSANNIDLNTITLQVFAGGQWSNSGISCARDTAADTTTLFGFTCTVPHFSTYSVTGNTATAAPATPASGGSAGGGGTVVDITTYPDSFFALNPLSKFKVLSTAFVDAQGTAVSQVPVGKQVSISSSFKNFQQQAQSYAYIVQIIDKDGYVIDLGWLEGSVDSGRTVQLSRPWTPGQEGIYTIQIFLWSGVSGPPIPLSEVTVKNLSVAE